MNRIALIMVVVMSCSLAAAAGEDAPPTFSVSGYGKVFYEADTVDLVFGVTTGMRM